MWAVSILRNTCEGWNLTSSPSVETFDQAEWQRSQKRQALAYHFLSDCFYRVPGKDWFSTLCDQNLFAGWPFQAEADSTKAGLTILAAYCDSWDSTKIGELEWDYNQLFVGPGEMYAPPWESVHQSKTGLTFQDSTFRIRELYHEFSLQAPAVHREPDDHIALELAFVAQLSELAFVVEDRKDSFQLDRYLQAQRKILGDHLFQWAPACLKLVDTHAATDYYRGVAQLTMGCLEESGRLCGLDTETIFSV